MRKIEIINIEKAKNNGHCYVEMRAENDCRQPIFLKYSFKVASCKPSYGNVMINTLTSEPVPIAHFDDYCWDFEGLDFWSEARKSEMITGFKRQACS